jgi:Zn-dependent peptidase ImmA (M78 family)
MNPGAETDVPFMGRGEIERRAAEVRRKHSLVSIPVDPVVLAGRLGIAVNNAKFSDDSTVGMIARRGNNRMLLVNESDPPYRKRFTIAHEIGHHFLHLMKDGEFVDGEADLFRQPPEDESQVTPVHRMEIQANMFAAALLMPEDAVRAEWEGLKSIPAMARRFNVSQEAMGIRIGQLGLG